MNEIQPRPAPVGDVTRDEPFAPIYKHCNAGNSKAKLANLPSFPRLIDVEMTNTCNFRCLMCPTGTFAQKRDKGFMSEEVFRRLLDQIRPQKTPLRFIRWGEPMMHPQIIEFLQAAHDQGSILHINSNGSHFDEKSINALCDIPLDSMKFSFQGVDRKSYGEMRNIDFFDQLIDVIRKFVAIRGDREKPFIQVSTSITYENPEQVKKFRDLLEPLVDKIGIGRTVLEHLDLNAVRIRPQELEMLKWLKDQQSLIREHPECPEVFDKLSVNWDGTVSACCGDSDKVMVIGDIKTQTIDEIWRTPELNRYREMLADMRHDELPLCRTCYDEQSLNKPGRQQV